MSQFAKGGKAVENVEVWSEEIVEHCNKLSINDDQETQQSAMKYFLDGVMPKKTRSQFIDLALNARLVPILMNILSTPEQDLLHSNCISILGHIASSTSIDHARVIVEAGCIPMMVSMLTSPASSLSVKDQAAWAIGKICEKSIQYRSQIIGEGGLDALIQVATALPIDKTSESITAGRKVSWALSTFYGRKPFVNVKYLTPMVSVFEHLLEMKDDEMNVNVCRIISTLAEGPQEEHIVVMTAGALPLKLVELLAAATSVKVLSMALRAIGGILAGEDYHAIIVVNAAPALFLSTLARLLTHDNLTVRKDCLWIISNITAGSREQVQLLMDVEPTILPKVLQVLASMDRKQEFEEKQEALWVIHNIVTGFYKEHKVELLRFENPNVFAALLPLVQCQDSFTRTPRVMIVNNALESILKLLDAAREAGLLEISIERLRAEKAEELLESCLNHPNEDTVNFAGSILDDFFAAEGDDADAVGDEN